MQLIGMSIGTVGGPLGRIEDVYFDDQSWAVRYLVVETASWLRHRKVLISPISVLQIDWARNCVETSLSFEQVRGSPGIDTDKPIYRQHEVEFFGYYGFPVYWGGAWLWGGTPYPGVGADATTHFNAPGATGIEAPADQHLRSLVQIDHYRVRAKDGPLGHVRALLVEEKSWALQHLAVDTSQWMAGRQVSIPTQWISGIDWADHVVDLRATQDDVRRSFEYDAALEYSRGLEKTFFHSVPGNGPAVPSR